MIEVCESCGRPAVLVPVEVPLEGEPKTDVELFGVCAGCASLVPHAA
jgi:hypothetical protein